MIQILLRRAVLAVAVLGLGAATIAACAVDNNVVLADDPDSSFTPPSLTPPPSEAGADVSAPPSVLLCEGTECPAPYATCGATASIHCGTNLLTDAENCGACGNVCPTPDPATAPRCTNGKCAFDCRSVQGFCRKTDYADCNMQADDGCETAISEDPANCGKCGNVCPNGQQCTGGACGCPVGKTFCPSCSDTSCFDTVNDDDHCGGCQNRCPVDDPAKCNGPLPKNTHLGCAGSACGAIKCNALTADCNADLGKGCKSDGCEVDFTLLDPKNCGGCGKTCLPTEECRDEGGNGPKCLVKCADSGRTQCGDTCDDLLSDPLNCGGCGVQCPTVPNGLPQCIKGICQTKCAAGFADCDGNPSNGCEDHVLDDPLSCGGCGVACNVAAGQPCIDGKCLMVECDAGVTK